MPINVCEARSLLYRGTKRLEFPQVSPRSPREPLGNGSTSFEHEPDYDFAFSSADGGGRTHTTLRSPDFESGASASSATSAYFQGRMVDRFCKKRKGFVAHFHNRASIAPTELVTLGVDSQRKKIRTGSVVGAIYAWEHW